MMAPTLADIQIAHTRLQGRAVRTPLIRNQRLNELVGGEVFLKCENLQTTGSFKFRGGYNAVAANLELAKSRGVVASSSGNHAQGVAEACRIFGVEATIIMPSDAPISKKTRTKRSGAKLVEYDRINDDRDAILDQLALDSGALKIHPYEHPDVIAGQGTVGLEVCEQLADFGKIPDHIVVCAGGGGLVAGMYIAMCESFPRAVFHTAEPVGHDDQARSHKKGVRLSNIQAPATVQDAIVTPSPGELSFAMLNGKMGNGLAASDDEVFSVVKFAFEELKLVVEPGGACALACMLNGSINLSGQIAVVTLSGGNIDADMMVRALKA